jgi:hypothetical protein
MRSSLMLGGNIRIRCTNDSSKEQIRVSEADWNSDLKVGRMSHWVIEAPRVQAIRGKELIRGRTTSWKLIKEFN